MKPIPLTVIFLSDPGVRPVGRDDDWAMVSEWPCQVYSAEGELTTFTVPAGFVTNLASVPRAPFVYILYGNKARRASILHDYLYFIGLERELADSIFYAGMKDEVGAAGRWAMWLAVRLGGASHYASKGNTAHPETNREAP